MWCQEKELHVYAQMWAKHHREIHGSVKWSKQVIHDIRIQFIWKNRIKTMDPGSKKSRAECVHVSNVIPELK